MTVPFTRAAAETNPAGSDFAARGASCVFCFAAMLDAAKGASMSSSTNALLEIDFSFTMNPPSPTPPRTLIAAKELICRDLGFDGQPAIVRDDDHGERCSLIVRVPRQHAVVRIAAENCVVVVWREYHHMRVKVANAGAEVHVR